MNYDLKRDHKKYTQNLYQSISYLNNYDHDHVAMLVTFKFILREVNVARICTFKIVHINV
jgi:hypothetical protein